MSSLLIKATFTVVLQWGKLRGGVSSTIPGFACDPLIVTVMFFYRPCPCFSPTGDRFRTEKVLLCLPERTKSLVSTW